MGFYINVETQRGKKLKHGIFAQMDIYTKIAFVVTEVLWAAICLLLLFTVGLNSLFGLVAVAVFWIVGAAGLFILVTKQNKDYDMSSVKLLFLRLKNNFIGGRVYQNANYSQNVDIKFMNAKEVKEVFEKETLYKNVRHERLRGSIRY